VLLALFDLSPAARATALFAAGWAAGWFLLARPRTLPRPSDERVRASCSVVVPARDEAHAIGAVVAAVVGQLRPADELVVVDDHSADGTGAIARAGGATVVVPPALPPGWAGKPHACHHGALRTSGDLLVFIDADVSPQPDLLDRLAAAQARAPGALVSVQPYHAVRRPHEQLSLVCNLAALMGSSAFAAPGPRAAARVAFGPVLAASRSSYLASGGHAHPDVRGAVLEDIALARRFPVTDLYVGSRRTTTFRMYPTGLRPLVEGWTKGMGIGVDATRRWALVLVAAWVSSLAGGWLASPWFGLASGVQLAVLGRRVGSFHPVTFVLHPLPTLLFVVVTLRAVVLRRAGRTVTWKGRRLRPDQAAG